MARRLGTNGLAGTSAVPRVYFSNQDKSSRTAGVGAAERIDGSRGASELAGGSSSRTGFYGGGRFDPEADVRDEAGFGRAFSCCRFLSCGVRRRPLAGVPPCWAHDGSGPLTGSVRRVARCCFCSGWSLQRSFRRQHARHRLARSSLSPDDWEEAIGRLAHRERCNVQGGLGGVCGCSLTRRSSRCTPAAAARGERCRHCRGGAAAERKPSRRRPSAACLFVAARHQSGLHGLLSREALQARGQPAHHGGAGGHAPARRDGRGRRSAAHELLHYAKDSTR